MNDKNKQQNDLKNADQTDLEGQKGGQAESSVTDLNKGNTEDVAEVTEFEEDEDSDVSTTISDEDTTAT